MSSSSIRIENVHKYFTLESQVVRALSGVSLDISLGSLVGVTGRSGSGKSTLLHLIGMLDRPSQGSIYINDQDISSMSDYQASQVRNQTIGFVFQMNNLLPEFSALENVMMPALISGRKKGHIREQARSMLESVGLGRRLIHRPGELSGGEQQRVAIARALIMSPQIILADEPTGNLDKKSGLAVEELLLSLCEQYQITMLLVTHDLELAARLPKRIVLEDGKIV